MSDFPKKMLFITGLSEGGSKTAELIPVDVLGENPRISGGFYIRYPDGGSDTTQSRFLFELPEGLQSENETLRQQLAKSEAYILRKQAETVEAQAEDEKALFGFNTAAASRMRYSAQRLRNQASELEAGGGDEPA